MIVVPAFPHRQQRGEAPFAPVNRRAANLAHQLAVIVSEMTDRPVAEDRSRYARTDPPEHEGPAAAHEQQRCQRQLLRHPGALEKPIEAIMRDARLDTDDWRPFQLQLAVELPPCI